MRSHGLFLHRQPEVRHTAWSPLRSRARTSTCVLSMNPHDARVLERGDGIPAK